MKTSTLVIALLLSATAAFSQNISSSAQESAGTSLANLQALIKGNAVQLSWVAINERSLVAHEIQRSTNGSPFRNIGTLTAQNEAASSNYTFVDATPVEGNNYYRLRSIDKNGNETFSSVLQLNHSFGRTDLKVLGNPAQAGVLNLQLQNIN